MFFGQANTGTPNRQSYIPYPTAGYAIETLDPSKLDPFGESYAVALPGKVDLSSPVNSIIAVDSVGAETVLLIENVDVLPDPLELGKCYISSRQGFQSTIYLSLGYGNYSLKIKVGLISSVLTVQDVTTMFPIGQFQFSIFPFEQSKFMKLCNGQTVLVRDFQDTAQYIAQTPGLATLLNLTSETFNIPNLQNVYPLAINSVAGINAIIPGGKETRTLIPKAGFKAPHTHNFTGSNFNNGKRNDAAGVTGPQPNEGSTTRTTATATPTLDFNQFQSLDNNQFRITDTFGGGPYAPMYVFMIVR